MQRHTVAALLTTLVSASCGTGGGVTTPTTASPTTIAAISTTTPTEQVVAFRLVDAMLEDADETNPMSDPTSVECLAEGVVADLGLERLAVLGLTVERSPLPEVLFDRMAPDELARVVAIALECEDFGARLHEAVLESGVSVGSAECFITVLDDTGFVFRVMRDVGLLRIDVDQPETDDLLAEMEAAGDQCLTESEQGLLFGTADTTIPEGDS